MLGTLVITWREGIEASLIVGILLTYLAKVGQRSRFRYVFWGATWAVLASLCFAYLSTGVSYLFEGMGEDFFDVTILLLAVIVMTHMVFWMHRHARELKGELQRKADRALEKKQLWLLSVVAFIGVFREGVETVLFLWGLALQRSNGGSFLFPLLGGVLGLVLAVTMAWLFFKGFGHMNLRPFFRFSGVLLLILAAGLLATAIRKLIGSEILQIVLPGWVSRPLWDSSWLLDERNLLGSLAAGLLGYASHPSPLEVAAYLVYLGTVLFSLRVGEPPAPSATQATAISASSLPKKNTTVG